MRKPISVDLRERIVAAYGEGEGTREEVARRFKVSLGMVKKLLQQQSRTGDLRPRYRFCGRKAKLMPEHGKTLQALVAKEPDLTLAEMKERLGLGCTVAAIQSHRDDVEQSKIPAPKSRGAHPSQLLSAIAAALRAVTAQDALGWFVACGYNFI